MPSLFRTAQLLDGIVPRRLIAAAANAMLAARGGDGRHFKVLPGGLWLNRQPEVSFVSPDINSAHLAQVSAAALQYWCQDYVPQAGDTVIDVGAGIGEEAVVFSRLVGPSGRVVSIEAHPRTFRCLEATVRLSKRPNVTTLKCAVAGEPGSLFITDDSQHLGNSVVATDHGIEVEAVTLDQLIERHKIDRVDLLKMNIEGAERAAMEGMAATARITRFAAISCHDFVAEAGGGDTFRSRAAVEAALHGFGFEIRSMPDAQYPWHRDVVFARKP